MAAATLSTSYQGQGIIRSFKFTSVADTNTFAFGGSPKTWWTSVVSSSTAAVNASFSSGTFTFKVSTGTPDVVLHILL